MRMPPSPAVVVNVRSGPYYLCAFDDRLAPIVASWVRDGQDLLWLAPKTPPPLTATKVMAWVRPDGFPFLLRRDDVAEPLGYLELNPMSVPKRHFWMGHCVIDARHRGRGLGRLMVDLMLDEAFLHRRMNRVSLIVFPDNLPAVRCYRRAGFLDVGEQARYFPTTGRQCRMLQMSIDRERHEQIRAGSA